MCTENLLTVGFRIKNPGVSVCQRWVQCHWPYKKGRTGSGLFCLAYYCLVKHLSPSDYYAAQAQHDQEQ